MHQRNLLRQAPRGDASPLLDTSLYEWSYWSERGCFQGDITHAPTGRRVAKFMDGYGEFTAVGV